MRLTKIRPEFVCLVPTVLEPGVAYVSMEYATVLHLCCCGCGNQVVTPLAPARWHLWFDGRTITLDPSIGNWSFPCQSHYWIEGNVVVWDRPFSRAEIERVRGRDRRAMERHAALCDGEIRLPEKVVRRGSWPDRVKGWLQGWGSRSAR